MAIKVQKWTPDTMEGVSFFEQYDDTDYDGTVTCIEVQDRAGTLSTTDPANAQMLYLRHKDNNIFKNQVLIPAMVGAVHPSDKSGSDLLEPPTFKTQDIGNEDDLFLERWEVGHPSSFGLATAAIAQAKTNRGSRPPNPPGLGL